MCRFQPEQERESLFCRDAEVCPFHCTHDVSIPVNMKYFGKDCKRLLVAHGCPGVTILAGLVICDNEVVYKLALVIRGGLGYEVSLNMSRDKVECRS